MACGLELIKLVGGLFFNCFSDRFSNCSFDRSSDRSFNRSFDRFFDRLLFARLLV